MILLVMAGFCVSLEAEPLEWAVTPPLPRKGAPFLLELRVPLTETLKNSLSQSPQRPIDPLGDRREVLPPHLQLLKGPNVLPLRERNLETGQWIEQLLISYTLVSSKAGKARISPARFQVGGVLMDVKPFILPIAQSTPPYEVPFELEWIQPRTPLYVGQAVPLLLVASPLKQPSKPDALRVDPPKAGLLERVDQFQGDLTEGAFLPSEEHQVMARFIYTPFSGGTHRLPAVMARVGEREQELEGEELLFLPLPPAANRTGGIGKFTLVASLDPQGPSVGSSATLRLRVEGVGNLHWLKVPPPIVEGVPFFYEGRVGQFHPTLLGYEGWVEERYRLYPQREGGFTVRFPAFPYWDPIQGKTVEIQLPPLPVQVPPRSKTEEPPALMPLEKELPLLPSGLRVSGWATWMGKFQSYLALVPAVLGMISGWLKRGRRYGWYAVGWVLFGMVLYFHPIREEREKEIIGYYARGRELWESGQKAEAVFYLRKAALGSPHPFFRKGLEQAEIALSVPFRAPLPSYPGEVPDYWFFLGLLVVHVIVLSWLRVQDRRRVWLTGFAVFSFLLVLLGTTYSLRHWRRPWGVVTAPQAYSRMVPSPEAKTVVPLSRGSSFLLGKEKDEFVLVETEGFKGWTEKKNLLRN